MCQVIIQRLEAESAAAVQAAHEETAASANASIADLELRLMQAKKAESRMAERFRAAGVSQAAAEEKLHEAEQRNKELRCCMTKMLVVIPLPAPGIQYLCLQHDL